MNRVNFAQPTLAPDADPLRFAVRVKRRTSGRRARAACAAPVLHPCWLLQRLGRSNALGTDRRRTRHASPGIIGMQAQKRLGWNRMECRSVRISVPGVDGIVFGKQRIADLVWQFPGFWFHHNSRVTIRWQLCAERSIAVVGGYDTSPRIGADYMESV